MADYEGEKSESGNWNSAKDYSQAKIVKLLREFDEYETLARFGVGNPLEGFIIPPSMKDQARIEGIKWLHSALDMLIGNVLFAVRNKNDKEYLNSCKLILEQIEPTIDNIYGMIHSQKTKSSQIIINELEFSKLLKMLRYIKDHINEPLNNADLIFLKPDDFDPTNFKNKLKDKLKNQG